MVITFSVLSFLSGTYMNHTQAGACDPCPPRYYCVNKDRADPCPQGRVCEGSTGFNMTLCPSGTYSNVELLMDTAECKACDAGSHCDAPGLTAVSGPCSAGYYCQSGVDVAAPSGTHTGSGGRSCGPWWSGDTQDSVLLGGSKQNV